MLMLVIVQRHSYSDRVQYLNSFDRLSYKRSKNKKQARLWCRDWGQISNLIKDRSTDLGLHHLQWETTEFSLSFWRSTIVVCVIFVCTFCHLLIIINVYLTFFGRISTIWEANRLELDQMWVTRRLIKQQAICKGKYSYVCLCYSLPKDIRYSLWMTFL